MSYRVSYVFPIGKPVPSMERLLSFFAEVETGEAAYTFAYTKCYDTGKK